jgi:inosine-uridine nucleoside N-ribohydrolase
MTDNTIPIIIDTDPGVDDTLALLYACKRQLKVTALTTVFGNASLDDVTRNAGYVTKSLGCGWAIYKGADRPLVGKARFAESHGGAGLGNVLPTDEQTRPARPESALEFLTQALATPKDLFCLGPLTTIASLPRQSLANINRLIIMGGAFTERGNVTQAAEFNVYNDPQAWQIVMDTATTYNIDTVIVPVEVCRKVLLTRGDLNVLAAKATLPDVRAVVEPYLNYYVSSRGEGKYKGAVLYDVLVPLYYERPELFTTVRGRVKVICKSGANYARTILQQDPNSTIQVCVAVQAASAKELCMQALG